MALTATTATSAIGVNDISIVVASATGFTPGAIVRIDQEVLTVGRSYPSGNLTVPVHRGQDGTATAAHPSGAKVLVETVADLNVGGAGPLPQTTTQFPAVRGRAIKSYSASGAITLPTPGSDMVAFLNGTSALTMSLANPTADQDGDVLYIIGNGKAAHVVNYTAGLGSGGGTLDAGTAAAGNLCAVQLMAAGGFWVYVGVPSATGAANAFLWA